MNNPLDNTRQARYALASPLRRTPRTSSSLRSRVVSVLTGTAVLLLGSCGGPSPDASAAPAPEPLPEGAIAFDYDGHLYFDTRICDSLPARLIFDTGATFLYVDSLWLAHSGYKPKRMGTTYMGTALFGARTIRSVLDSMTLQIDTLHIPPQQPLVPVMDLKSILGRRADGVFGQLFFADQCVQFNLRKGWMRSVQPDTLQAAGFTHCAIEKRHDRLYVQGRITLDAEHVLEGLFFIDTGASGISISQQGARAAGLESYTGPSYRYRSSLGDTKKNADATSCLCRAASLTLGGYTLRGVPIGITEDSEGVLANTKVMGLIGNEVLERFDFAIDFAAPALYLRPTAEFDAPFKFKTFGFGMIDRTDICDGWIVTTLYENLAPAGLQSGDIIVAWDGQPLKGNPAADSLMKAPGRHEIRALRNGAEQTYTTESREIL